MPTVALPTSAPPIIPEPFAQNAAKNTIPQTQATAGNGLASYDGGFPPETMLAVSNGGKPPSGLDFQGILFAITSFQYAGQAGFRPKFNPTVVANSGGYPIGYVLQSDDGTAEYRSAVANNTANFNTDPSQIGSTWLPYAGDAVSGSGITTVNTTGGTTTLTNLQSSRQIINVTGALTSNAVIVFPTTMRGWTVINNTTGAFTLACKTSAAAGVTISQSSFDDIVYNGTSIISELYNTNLQGTPTAPTPPAGDSSTRIATMAALQTAVANATTNSVVQYKNAAFTAGITGEYWTDTLSASFTMTLPDPPTNQNIIKVRDVAGNWSVNPLTINPGTKTILGDSSLICNVSGEEIGLWYNGSDWKVI